MPAVSSVGAPESMLKIKRGAGFERLPPALHSTLDIVRMKERRPARVLDLLKRKPGELAPLPVDVVRIAARRSRENLLRHRFRHEPKSFPRVLRVSKRHFPLAKCGSQISVPRLDARQHLIEPVYEHAQFVA